ncbi:DNA polymerase IV [bacterium]|nr:DNA polymerase IV [bacterium]
MPIIRIVHIDLTAFFVSVERILNPSLVGKPIMVAGPSSSRGVVTCASYEVRKYGVRAGMSTAMAEKKCPVAIRIDGHFSVYQEYSEKIQALIKYYAPRFESASIDEFYLDWTGCERIFGGDLYKFALRLQKTILSNFGLPCAIGIASNKMAAKVACDQAKPDGVIEIVPGKEAQFLEPLSVSVLSGVGAVMLERLNSRGIRTCGQFAKLDSDYVGKAFGKSGLAIQSYAKGYGEQYLITAIEQKQISREETFATDTRDAGFLSNMIHDMSLEISEELRSMDLRARCIRIKLRYSDWVDHTRQITVEPTNDPIVIYKTALSLFHKADDRRVTIRLIGVGITKFTQDRFTIDLLRQNEERREWLLKAVDIINHRYGNSAVRVGSVALINN